MAKVFEEAPAAVRDAGGRLERTAAVVTAGLTNKGGIRPALSFSISQVPSLIECQMIH
jgi:hypothetical protein